jgi:hypothetical protein
VHGFNWFFGLCPPLFKGGIKGGFLGNPVVLTGIVVAGYGVASGAAPSGPYPEGTIRMQLPHFLERGFDIRPFVPATINLDISPSHFAMADPDVTLQQVSWTDRIPPETFSFCACTVTRGVTHYRAMIYYPHPETKVEHHHDDSLMELLAEPIEGLSCGERLTVTILPGRIRIWSG